MSNTSHLLWASLGRQAIADREKEQVPVMMLLDPYWFDVLSHVHTAEWIAYAVSRYRIAKGQ